MSEGSVSGEFFCDKCGGSVGSGGIVDAAVLNVLMADGRTKQWHFCMSKDAAAGTERCVTSTVLSATNTKGFRSVYPDGDVSVFVLSRDVNDDGTVGNG